MSKKKKLNREERAERRMDLAAFYQYKANEGQFPISFDDTEIIQGICDALERSNGLPRLREILESWKTTGTCAQVSADLEEFVATLPETLEEAKAQGFGLSPEDLLEKVSQKIKQVHFIDIQGDAFKVTAIHRLGRASGYDKGLNLPSYLILINKNIEQGDHLSSTMTYTYYSEQERDKEWDRIKKALTDFQHVTFIN